MRIARDLTAEIIAHAREEAPDECCGIVSGPEGRAERVERARNAEASPLRYALHPQDQLRIMSRIEADGEDLVAIYHSHTRSEAYPSQTDVNLAEMWPDPVYLIVSLAGPGDPVIRGFYLREGTVDEVELELG